jgi:hypothetical protein
MNLFLGEKENLGVELIVLQRDKNHLIGYARIWLGGNSLGTISDCIYLESYLLGGLERFLGVGTMTYSNFPQNPEGQLLYLIEKSNDLDDTTSDRYLVNFGTFMDCFELRAFKKDGYVTILWKCLPDRGIFPDLLNYPKETFSYSIEESHLRDFFTCLYKILANW